MGMFGNRSRAPHLGKYPMEKLTRVDRPTTYISDDVPRAPKRADFFMRVASGDLGEKLQKQRFQMGMKSPLWRAISKMSWAQVPLHKGEVAEDVVELDKDPEEVARHLKSMCYFMDADMVGICEIPEYAWYSHDAEGNEIDPVHKYAVVILTDQGHETLEGSSGDDYISNAVSFRAYTQGATTACVVADYIRQLGHSARVHSALDSDLLHLPLILYAGLGELSRIGEVALNPYLGPRFKSTIVSTNLPMAIDKPIDFGLQDFCAKCRKCANACPCNAISLGDKVMFNGYEMWKPDVEKCTSYRISNSRGGGCSRCMKMCPFNKEDGVLANRFAIWLAIKVPPLRGLLARMDDWLGFGNRNQIKNWWWNLVYGRDGKMSWAAKVNERDLSTEKRDAALQKLGMFPADMYPPSGAKDDAVPIDRAEGVKRYQTADSPPTAVPPTDKST